MTHELKILPVYFEAVANGRKQFEIRKNDRDFQVGDQLILKEWNKDGFTGRSYQAEITYITDYMQKNGYVVLSIRAGGKANEKL
ncbi:ASCH/PUA domain-containing protein [Enterococcus sp. C76]|uniref:ASCH/PUA domain-containing protein n=1 Tax=Enterococcus sp. C76 TaxID=3231334 RepID=UPI00349FE3BB